jgi:hypothetical protein
MKAEDDRYGAYPEQNSYPIRLRVVLSRERTMNREKALTPFDRDGILFLPRPEGQRRKEDD